MSGNFIIEVSPIRPDGQLETIRMSTRGLTSKAVYLDGQQWLPLIETPPVFSATFYENGRLALPDISYGDLEFIISDAFTNEHWSNFDWTGAPAMCWYSADTEADFSAYERVFTGRVSGYNRQDIYAKVALLGTQADLQTPLLTQKYSGTGGREGNPGIKGQFKPRVYGFCRSLEPVLFDTVYLVYQVHGYGAIQGIPAVYEFAQKLSDPVQDCASYEALIALPLAQGQWATCLAEGMFRMGGLPTKKLVCDVMGAKFGGTYLGTVKQITQAIIREVVPSATFGIWAACHDVEWCAYITDQTSAYDVAVRAVYEAGGALFPDGMGAWQAPDFYTPVARGDLRSDRTTQPLVISYEETTSTGPIWQVDVKCDRCWSVHSIQDISPAILDVENLALSEELEDAKARFDAALSDRFIQQQRLAAMAGDGVLTRAEKLYWTLKFDYETTARTEAVALGSPYDVAAFITAYNAAYDALTAYLYTLSPAWNDYAADTQVDYAVWSARWNALWDAKVALAQAMIGVADWSKVSGSGKPEDNATVGAPAGTLVAGTPAEQLVDQVNNFTGIDLYPVIEMVQGVAELGQRNLTANDRAAAAYRDEAMTHVDELRADVLADGTNWQEAIDNLTTKTGNLQTAITNERTLSSNEYRANADQINIVAAKANANEAAILEEKSATATRFEAQATKLEELEAEVGSAQAGISAEQTARANAVSAEASARQQQIANLNGSLNAAIQSETKARADSDGALGSRIDQVNATAADAHARITTENQARVSGEQANARAIQTVQSNLNGTNNTLALVQQTASTTSNRMGHVEAQYGFSVQAGGVIAGMKALANGSGTSQIVFEAGAIAFRNPGNGSNNQLMVFENGQLRLNSAMIGTATINSLHVQDLSMGTNKIAINAVTVTHYAERGSMMYGNGGYQTSLSYTLYAPNECELIVLLKGNQGFPNGDRTWQSRILVNGNVVDDAGGAKTADTYTLLGKMRVGPGNHTVEAHWRGDSSVRLGGQRMIVLETRR